MPKIYLYAEVLTHLRQLTLYASLQTEKKEDTKIDVSSDKKIITVVHDGESSSLYLPTQISGTAKVTFPSEKKTELSARVQIDDLEQWKETDAAGVEAPWNASDLSSDTSFSCSECDTFIVHSGTIATWKDLPNQNWAEVMDLWFCHKPHEHHDDDHQTEAARAKGFSAQSKLMSEPGVGLVDLVSFAVHPDDCKVLKTTEAANYKSFRPTEVKCSQCNLQVGVFSLHDNLVRLDKSTLRVKNNSSGIPTSYPPATFVSAQLLELIESTAVRKVVVYSQTEPESRTGSGRQAENNNAADGSRRVFTDSTSKSGTESVAAETTSTEQEAASAAPPPHSTRPTSSDELQPLLLWIFNPDIYYSSSRLISTTTTTTTTTSNPTTTTNNPTTSKTTTSTTTLLPRRASKILYRPFPQFQPQSDQPHETLPIPAQTLSSLHRTLQHSTTLLPPTARTFITPTLPNNNQPSDPWHIGLLDRYERHPTAERVMAMNPLARELVGSSPDGELSMRDGRPVVTRWEVPLPPGAAGLFD